VKWIDWYSVIWEPKGQAKGLPMVAISDCDLYFKTKTNMSIRDFSKIIAYAENCQNSPAPVPKLATLAFCTKHAKDSCDSKWRREDKKDQFCSLLLHIAALYMCSIITMSNDIPFITEGFKVFWEKINHLVWFQLILIKNFEVRTGLSQKKFYWLVQWKVEVAKSFTTYYLI